MKDKPACTYAMTNELGWLHGIWCMITLGYYPGEDLSDCQNTTLEPTLSYWWHTCEMFLGACLFGHYGYLVLASRPDFPKVLGPLIDRFHHAGQSRELRRDRDPPKYILAKNNKESPYAMLRDLTTYYPDIKVLAGIPGTGVHSPKDRTPALTPAWICNHKAGKITIPVCTWMDWIDLWLYGWMCYKGARILSVVEHNRRGLLAVRLYGVLRSLAQLRR